MTVAGLIDALHYAGCGDALAVLSALEDSELAAGVAGARLSLAVAVSDHVVERARSTRDSAQRAVSSGLAAEVALEGPMAAAVALARRALADETVADPDSVIRALIRLADPDVDAVLFRAASKRSSVWVRRAILHDRRGADGHPVVPPEIGRFVRQQLAGMEGRQAAWARRNTARVEGDLLAAAVGADDPKLVAVALPIAIRANYIAGVLHGLRTLRSRDQLDELWAGGLRDTVQRERDDAGWRGDHWNTVLEYGDGNGAYPDGYRDWYGPRQGLPSVTDADGWTAPGVGSQHSDMAWDRVLAYAMASQGSARGLDEAALREDMPEELRATFEDAYARAVFWTQRPDITTLQRAQDKASERLNPAMRHFATRELMLRGLLCGSVSAADVVEHASPAAEVLALAVPVPAGLAEYYTRKGANSFAPHYVKVPDAAHERCRADVRAAVVEVLDALGDDVARWRAVLTRVGAWEGSFAELVRRVADEGDAVPASARRAYRWPRGIDSAAVLLELAPAAVVDGLIAAAGGLTDLTSHQTTGDPTEPTTHQAAGDPANPTSHQTAGYPTEPTGHKTTSDPTDATAGPSQPDRVLQGILTRILDRGPIPHALITHALSPNGTSAMRRALARNPACPPNVLWQLAQREPAEPDVLAAVFLHPDAPDPLRETAITRSEAVGRVHPALVRRLTNPETDRTLLPPALVSQDPVLLHAVLRRVTRDISKERRALAYANLAEAAGLEPVWALEIDRAGHLDRMDPAVRTSMAAGNLDALRQAAGKPPGPVRAAVSQRVTYPRGEIADSVRTHLDGRPGLWLELAESDAAEPLPDLLNRLESASK